MKDEEIKKEMEKYTEALKNEKNSDLFDEKKYDYYGAFLDDAKENAHKIAIECLNKILTPELKIFIKNLCLNKLGYPDEPLFYKIFGDYPENGTKISEEELAEKGITINDFYTYYDLWNLEGNYVEVKEINGKKYIVLEELFDNSSETPDEMLEELKKYQKLQEFRKYIINSNIEEDKKEEILKILDDDIDKIQKPLIGKVKI